MDLATMARACEPFFTTKGLDGTGLGLPSVQGFATQSGGELRLISAPNQGTIVELLLPGAADDSPHPVRRERSVANVGCILLVDDVADVLIGVAAFLRTSGFTVVPASGPEVALRALREQGPFDRLVTDYAMPGMNGGELVTAARAICPDLPALLITGWTDMHALEQRPHAVALIHKPVKREVLVEHVRQSIAARTTEPSRKSQFEET
jgi:CheY-like chemotaxis protein